MTHVVILLVACLTSSALASSLGSVIFGNPLPPPISSISFDYRLHFVGDRRTQYVFDFFWCHFDTFRLAESSS